MNKTELVQMLSEKHGISLKVGKEALEMVLDALTAAFEPVSYTHLWIRHIYRQAVPHGQ